MDGASAAGTVQAGRKWSPSEGIHVLAPDVEGDVGSLGRVAVGHGHRADGPCVMELRLGLRKAHCDTRDAKA
eukprot:4340296-Alexandrium_andersonii.AAC.1